ncbi:unnamed protein product [Penicillium egyptiacum]|uniref:Uncharacterized protein n=1 Tax=Penicillium egyptiacum TaxID=1303716 RepID=A0A9W4KJG9_9EURO|nr:unnamed protein product [Penicillium egyptiacum]
MHLRNDCLRNINPSDIDIKREISRSEASTIYEIQLCRKTYTMKLFHDNDDLRYSKKGRDLNRFRCELNAHHNLHNVGFCDRGFVPASMDLSIDLILPFFTCHFNIFPKISFSQGRFCSSTCQVPNYSTV